MTPSPPIPIKSVADQSPSEGKISENVSKIAQNLVTSVYNAEIEGSSRIVTVTWLRNLMSHTLNIAVESPFGENRRNCKIDLKTWQFWGRKGLKSFEVDDEKRVDVFWDLREAKFASCPEPYSDYYVAVVCDEEVVLLLGDQKKSAFRRTKSRPSLVNATLLHRKESMFGRKSFAARTVFGKKGHEVGIEACSASNGNPQMSIVLDGSEIIRVTNLHWKFRGNQTVLVDDVLLQIFWDVHDWLYTGVSLGQGFFILKPVAAELGVDEIGDRAAFLVGKDTRDDNDNDGFCHVIYAWKIE